MPRFRQIVKTCDGFDQASARRRNMAQNAPRLGRASSPGVFQFGDFRRRQLCQPVFLHHEYGRRPAAPVAQQGWLNFAFCAQFCPARWFSPLMPQ